jgi:hypothetical protein
LKEVSEKDFAYNYRNSYAIDASGEITHLNLYGNHISKNQISEIKGLETLVNLQTLRLRENQISEMKGLETLVNLYKLWLQRNKIRNTMIGIKTLVNLWEIHVFGQSIELSKREK